LFKPLKLGTSRAFGVDVLIEEEKDERYKLTGVSL
jgi:hypothetical protein